MLQATRGMGGLVFEVELHAGNVGQRYPQKVGIRRAVEVGFDDLNGVRHPAAASISKHRRGTGSHGGERRRKASIPGARCSSRNQEGSKVLCALVIQPATREASPREL